MTRKAAMKQLFNFVQDEYNIKSSNHIQGTLLDMFWSFIDQAFKVELDWHLGYSEYDFKQIYQAIN